MNEHAVPDPHARTCPLCGDRSAKPVVGEVTASFDEGSGIMLMPGACDAGHRFVARIETEHFRPRLLDR